MNKSLQAACSQVHSLSDAASVWKGMAFRVARLPPGKGCNDVLDIDDAAERQSKVREVIVGISVPVREDVSLYWFAAHLRKEQKG